jgi:general secretion pathway protein G
MSKFGRLSFSTMRRIDPRRRPNRSQAGFSLLELMMAMFILIILLSVALPGYMRSVQHARETVLKQNLWEMRRQIDQFSSDKGKLPANLNDLVEGKYLRELPVDPILERAEWNEVQGEDPNSTERSSGLVNVKSLADGEDSEGKPYQEY